jgi:outer membrane protein
VIAPRSAHRVARLRVCAACVALATAHALMADVPPEPAAPCADGAELPKPLTLVDAVERAVCASPKTRQAWAGLRARAAAVGISRSAYLPSAKLDAVAGRASKNTAFPDNPQFDSLLNVDYTDASLNLSWILFDFGLRAANLQGARQLLSAAAAARDAAFQDTFLETAHAFNDAEAAQAALEAARAAEAASAQNSTAADKLYAANVGSLADKLQAQTALAQAVSRRVTAEGDLLGARGTLAMLMGLPPYTAVELAPIGGDGNESDLFAQAVEKLIAEAVLKHPRLRVVRAQLESARSDVAAARAQGRPTISLGAVVEHSDTPIAVATVREIDRTNTIALQVSVPLFDGFDRRYRTRQAEAQVAAAEAELSEAERRVGLEVWKSYQNVRTGAGKLTATDSLLKSARLSVEVAKGRYREGVGSMLELLKAQSDLAAAEQQRLEAILRMQDAKLQLASSLGRLGQ